MKIRFNFGEVLKFEDLGDNTIALDGVVQGPQIDAARRRFSFDHHAGCIRMVTLATCQQVATAIRLGLVVDAETEVRVNDLDADTSVAVWLLQNPTRVDEPRVKELVDRVGATDAHGPIFEPLPLHWELSLPYGSKEPQTVEMLGTFVEKVSQFADGVFVPRPPRPEQPVRGYGWSPSKGWYPFEAEDGGFNALYATGALAGFLFFDAQEGTRVYTLAKRSDLVPLPIGPGSVCRPAKSSEDYLLGTILGRLGLLEMEENPAQSHQANWGGATSIGGGPRNPGGVGSVLTPEQVLGVCRSFTEK